MVSDFKKNTQNILRRNARERSDRAGESPPSHGREIFPFWGSETCNMVHVVMRFLTLDLIRIWIKITYSRTHTETGSELLKKNNIKN